MQIVQKAHCGGENVFESGASPRWTRANSSSLSIGWTAWGMDGMGDLFLDVLPIAGGQTPRQFQVAKAFVDRAIGEAQKTGGADARISFAGQSLGGSLAGLFSVLHDKPAVAARFGPDCPAVHI